jgi:hypothetical protein
LERSSDSIAVAIRRLLDEWIVSYPEANLDDMAARFRSGDDTLFLSAFFELYLFKLAVKLGYEVEVHPISAETHRNRPDFLLHGPSGEKVYLEAVLVAETSQVDRSSNSLKSTLIDALNKLESPNFFIGIEERGRPKPAPLLSKLKADLRLWLDSLDPDACVELMKCRGLGQLPEFRWEHDGWKIRFLAHPKSPSLRGQPNVRTVGIQESGLRLVDPVKAIRKSLRKKVSRYGRLDYPYIIAVDALQPYVGKRAIEEALFGGTRTVWTIDPQGKEESMLEPAGDGVLIGTNQTRNTRLSAVLFAVCVFPTTVASKESKTYLYHNPWAEKPYRGAMCAFPQAKLEAGGLTEVEGIHAKDILGIDPDWLYDHV